MAPPSAALDLSQIAQQLAARFDPASLGRVKHWLGSLQQVLTGGPGKGSVPADPMQRPSLLFLDGLEEAACFDSARFEVAGALTQEFAAISAEFEAAQESAGDNTATELLFEDGQALAQSCARHPTLARLLGAPELPSRLGECQISVINPGRGVAAHHGPTNAILVGQLALRVPDGDCAMRIGADTRRWSPGECFVFDETFEHELWNRSDAPRYVVDFSVWHPDLTAVERQVIAMLFPRVKALQAAARPA